MSVGQLSYGAKSLVYILVGQRTSLEVGVGLLCVDPFTLGGVFVHSTAHVQLVSYYHEWNVRVICRSLEGTFPFDESLIAFPARDVVYEDAAVGAAVKSDTQGLKSFLARRVPQLQRHLGLSIVDRSPLFHEVGADCRLLRLANLFVGIAIEEGSFSDARLTNYDNFQVGTCLLTISTRHLFFQRETHCYFVKI